jgi:hypothetical protein
MVPIAGPDPMVGRLSRTLISLAPYKWKPVNCPYSRYENAVCQTSFGDGRGITVVGVNV